MNIKSHLGAVLAAFSLLAGHAPAVQAADKAPVSINIGYDLSWAVGGEIFETLRRTNILSLYGFDAKFQPFATAAPRGEAAVAGDTDIIWGTDAPALRPASRIPGSKIFFATHDGRHAIIAQPGFSGGLPALRGKTISALYATSTFPRSLQALIDAGIKDPLKEINIINQGVPESLESLTSKRVDAIFMWDPALEKLRQNGYTLLYTSRKGENVGWFGFTGTWLGKQSPETVVQFIKAYITAVWWTSNHLEQAHGWFSETSHIEKQYLDGPSKADRNLSRPLGSLADVDIAIDPATLPAAQQVIDFLVSQKLLSKRLDVASYVDFGPVRAAQQEIQAGQIPDLKQIKVIVN